VKLGILGTGPVGRRLAGKFIEQGHDVIRAARATEAWTLLWLRLWGVMQDSMFNLKITRQN